MEYKLSPERIKAVTLDLVRIKSVVGTKDENNVAERIHDILMESPYFKAHPDHLFFVENRDDPAGRKSLMARMHGRKDDNPKTAVLIGHIDTVGTSDFGDLEDYATEPEILMEKLKSRTLPHHIRKDLDSGNYLFGRGSLDMKSGVSIIICLLETLGADIENFSGSLVAAFVSDEEGNSGGMLSCVPKMARLKEEHGLQYQAGIDTDYTSMRAPEDPSRYLYAGTVGKLMPSFYVTGKETHVGDPFSGLDANELAAKLVEKINLSMTLSDTSMGETTVPPVTLRMKDLKPEYSVQTNREAFLYFNFSTHISTPEEVLMKLKYTAEAAFAEVMEKLDREYLVYTEIMALPHKPLPWKAAVATYDEVFQEVEKVIPEIGDILKDHASSLLSQGITDERDISLSLVRKLHGLWHHKEPAIILYFSPPYYPHIAVTGKTGKERKLLSVLEKFTGDNNGNPIISRKFYPYISDLSYFSLPEEQAVENLRRNMPGFGISYKLPLEDIRALSLPVTNIGPYGFDAHQYTERLEMDYSFSTLPDILMKAVIMLLVDDKKV